MAEINSAQAVRVAAGQKIKSSEQGKAKTLVITTPATFAQLSIADTIAGGQIMPKGCRPLATRISNGTGTALCTISVGLRKTDAAKTVVSATALAIQTAIATATTVPTIASNGTLIAAGVDNVLTEDNEVYLTVAGAVLAANQDVRVEVDYLE